MKRINTVDFKKLDKIMKENNYTWHKLVKKCNLSVASYRYKNRARPVPLEKALQISLLLDRPLQDFASYKILKLLSKVI